MNKAIIFDVDGTLSETEETHRRAFNREWAARDKADLRCRQCELCLSRSCRVLFIAIRG